MRRTPIFETALAAQEAFYSALARGDLEALMSVWADEDEAVCVHPSGTRTIGVDAIRASFEEIFSGGAVRVDTTSLLAYEDDNLAVHSLVEHVAVQGRMGEQVVNVVATNVYVRSSLGWSMLLHHASPADGEAEGAGRPQAEERPTGPLH